MWLRQQLLLLWLVPLLILRAAAQAAAEPVTRVFKWKAEHIYWSPDCVESVVIGINGEYPGPTIRATAGDTIQVDLENGLETEGLVIHWHGMLQRGTPFYDGAAHASQCPINPGETFQYKFVAERPGTYFYHGHFGLQRSAGLYGSLIVDPAPGEQVPFTYDAELSVVLNDWWHRSMYDQQAGLAASAFRFVGDPQSLLIQGRGLYNCSLVPGPVAPLSGNAVSCNASREQCKPHVLAVERGKTYRLRIASVASLSSLNFMLEGHQMTLVEADGHYVEPVELTDLDLYAGQTYSVLFTANQDGNRNYWAAVGIRGRRAVTPPGLAVLSYNAAAGLPTSTPPTSPAWNDFARSEAQQRLARARRGFAAAPPRPRHGDRGYRRLILLSTQSRIGGRLKWAVNNVTYVARPTPLLAALKFNLSSEATGYEATPPPAGYHPGYRIHDLPPSNESARLGSAAYIFGHGDVVDVVIQNANTLVPNNSEIHPWHLHGHDFWVLGYGAGVFKPRRHAASLDLVSPPLRNTVAVFPYGWTYIRFVADNPGVWPFHCHIESHFYMGMGVVFAEGVDRLPTLPPSTLGCGATKSLIRS